MVLKIIVNVFSFYIKHLLFNVLILYHQNSLAVKAEKTRPTYVRTSTFKEASVARTALQPPIIISGSITCTY